MQTIYQYYIIENGHSVGPFYKEQLIAKGVNRDSPIWREGLSDWVAAYTLPELSDLFAANNTSPYYTATSQYGAPGQPQAPQHNPYPYNNQPSYRPLPTNWMPWAIVGTILAACTSCIGVIFGSLGIYYASKANTYYQQQLDDLGNQSNESAKTMTIIALVIDGLGILGIISFSCFLNF